jgi:hypothetical protein
MLNSNLAGGPRPALCRQPVSGPNAPKFYEAKKRLIATVPVLENYLKYCKQTDCSISNRNKNGHVAVCSSHSTLACPPKSAAADEVRVTSHFFYD